MKAAVNLILESGLEVELVLRKTYDGRVIIMGNEWNLLEFNTDGTVTRCSWVAEDIGLKLTKESRVKMVKDEY